MHFDAAHHQDLAAVERHLEFFRTTGMDSVKVQYEQGRPIHRVEDWVHLLLYSPGFFEETKRVAEGLVKAAGREALVVMTLYSPFKWACQYERQADPAIALQENPGAVAKGLAVMTENVLRLVRA